MDKFFFRHFYCDVKVVMTLIKRVHDVTQHAGSTAKYRYVANRTNRAWLLATGEMIARPVLLLLP